MTEQSKNRLGKETSPYLLQHKDNPVHWYAWGEEAFAAAREQNKLIFLSIGYSTCYWCHVMENDSFEHQEVGDALNKGFVSIKVDREERPDVDQVYMDAVVGLNGQGGWPMSVFLTPDLKPVWGGTFYYRDQFLQICQSLSEAWDQEPEKVKEQAEGITRALQERTGPLREVSLTEKALEKSISCFAETFDAKNGGFGDAPKFPPACQIQHLLRMSSRFGSQEALKIAVVTLEKMASGGIYDQLGGGFHRYSVDAEWLVPHFEKMLYDNALLAVSYIEAAQLTGNSAFEAVACETLEYVLRDMTSPEGGFYSAEDAGEVGKEGEFYVWKIEELEEVLDAESFAHFCAYYGVTGDGNFEHQNNILKLSKIKDWSLKYSEPLLNAHRKLLELRSGRTRPHRDEKILTAWNGMMITALAKAARAFELTRYRDAAIAAAEFIQSTLFDGRRLYHRFCNGETGIDAFLDDYSCLIEGLIELYQVSFDMRWLGFARELQQIQDETLWDPQKGAYRYSTAPELIVQRNDFVDGATPSGNSVSALNLLKLHTFYGDKELYEKANTILGTIAAIIESHPSAASKALHALFLICAGPKGLAVCYADEDKGERVLSEFNRRFQPANLIACAVPGSTDIPPLLEGRVNEGADFGVYVCSNFQCEAPVSDIDELMGLL